MVALLQLCTHICERHCVDIFFLTYEVNHIIKLSELNNSVKEIYKFIVCIYINKHSCKETYEQDCSCSAAAKRCG